MARALLAAKPAVKPSSTKGTTEDEKGNYARLYRSWTTVNTIVFAMDKFKTLDF